MSGEDPAPSQQNTDLAILTSLINNSDSTADACIGAVFEVICSDSENCVDKSSPTTKQTIALLQNLTQRQSLGSSPPSEQTLINLTKIMVAYTHIGSEGAIISAKLLSKLLKKSNPCLQMVEIICEEIIIPIQRKHQQKIGYYCTILQMLLGKISLTEEFFTEKVKPLIDLLMDETDEKRRDFALTIGKMITFEILVKQDLFWMALKKSGFLKIILNEIDANSFHLDEVKFDELCRRLSDLNATEFDECITSMFEYLIRWEETRNFEALGVVVDLLEVIFRVAPLEVKDELTNCLKTMDFWHVKILVCWELFGEPEGNILEKSDSTLPLELYINYKTNTKPSESLLKRVYSLKDELTYKFCLLALEEVLNFESELESVTKQLKLLISQHGTETIPRIRHVLSHELRQN